MNAPLNTLQVLFRNLILRVCLKLLILIHILVNSFLQMSSYDDDGAFPSRHFGGGGDNLVFPYNEFMPVLSKSSKNRKQYDLSGLITSRNGELLISIYHVWWLSLRIH